MEALLSCAVALGTWLAPAVKAAEVTIRFPVEYAIDIAPGLSNQDFKKLIEERTKGRVEVKLFPSGSLYKGLDLVQAILRGDAEMSTLTSAYWTALSPKVAVFELPYAFPERAAFYRAIDDVAFIDSLYDEVEAKGAKAITIMPYDHFGFGTRNKALRNPRDMAGLKMRGLGRTNSAMLQAFGASAGVAQPGRTVAGAAAGRDRRPQRADRHHAGLQVVRVRSSTSPMARPISATTRGW